MELKSYEMIIGGMFYWIKLRGSVMKIIKHVIVLLIAVVPTITLAAPVTLQSTWGSRFLGLFPLTFTYDDATVDSDSRSDVGVYNSPVLSVSLVYDNKTWTLDPDQPSSLMLLTNNLTIPTMNFFQFRSGVISSEGEHKSLWFGVEPGVGYFKNDTLSSLLDGVNGSYGMISLYGDGVNIGDGEIGQLRGDAIFSVVSVPLPGAFGFSLVGFLWLFSMRRAKK